MNYCLNFDWFEVFTYEPSWCTGPEWFEELGFVVVQREYGTRVYQQMFTVFTSDGLPWIEVRRLPLSKKSKGGILDDRACSIRLVNRSCYEAMCIQNLWNFLRSHGYQYKDNVCALSRVDVCLDFTELYINEKSVHPGMFMRDYMAGKYFKVNQPRVRAYGTEREDGLHFHQLSWGSPSSSVSCKLYNKSLEMAEQKTKPYIIDSWIKSGVLEGEEDDTTVYRIEFSLRAGTDYWISDKDSEFYLCNTIDAWLDTSNYIRFFNGLLRHYFQFAYTEEGKAKYKCNRFFPMGAISKDAYRPVKKVTTCKDSGRTEKMMINKLERLRDSGMVDVRYQESINAILHVFYTVYAMRKCKQGSDDLDVIKTVKALIESYNNELIERFFDYMIGNEDVTTQERYSIETAYACYIRDRNGLANVLLNKPPYSITAVELPDTSDEIFNNKLRLRALQKKLEFLESSNCENKGSKKWLETWQDLTRDIGALEDVIWREKMWPKATR